MADDWNILQSEQYQSQLGKKEYWDELHSKDLQSFLDTGNLDTWYGKSALDRILKWTVEKFDDKRDIRILDIGCGNGTLLLELANHNFYNLTGVDYSQNSIDLSLSVMRANNVKYNLELVDFTNEKEVQHLGTFDLCIDKGTLDAVFLHPTDSQNLMKRYIQNVCGCLKDLQSYFFLTSVNLTVEEIKDLFLRANLNIVQQLNTSVFQFGGKVGRSVTSVLLQKCK